MMFLNTVYNQKSMQMCNSKAYDFDFIANSCYSPEVLANIVKILWAKRTALIHAFGYNSAESEPIWMKFGTLWAKCWGLAPTDFGRDPRSSDSSRKGRNFVVVFSLSTRVVESSCQISRSKVIVRTQHTHTAGRLQSWTTKLVGKTCTM